MKLVFACRPDNDLFRVLTAMGTECTRHATAKEAIEHAPQGAGVLLLADGYPRKTTAISATLLERAAARKLRLYVEYPSKLPGLDVGTPRRTRWERAVVASDAFGPTLRKLRILAIHDCHFVPAKAPSPHIVAARVAGYDTAVYGLPKTTHPILFEHPRGDLLVATTKLSQFVTARYAPRKAWGAVWKMVLGWLCPDAKVATPRWTPTVRPSYSAKARLPADAELRAFRRGVEWFNKSGMLLDDGRKGLQEGYRSVIRHDGTQRRASGIRSDCVGESALSYALHGVICNEPRSLEVAANLTDYIYLHSPFAQGPRADPKSPSFGLVSWAKGERPEGIYYGAVNSRSMMGTLATMALLKSGRWEKPVLRCLLANLRTTGIYGFRGANLDEARLRKHGWRHYFLATRINPTPFFEGHLWAAFLWAYARTGFGPFLERTRTAIEITMAAYPDDWPWANGIQQERARLLLALAWLVRLDDTPEHRSWLRRIAADLLARQDACGAIGEELGAEGKGIYGPPKSNADYGKHEASLMQSPDDPVADMLYTCDFTLFALHEAAAATGDRFYADAEDRLAEFLSRIQVRSTARPELDGAWFRAFDFRRWEYWGSNADAGWGAWCVETGWSQGWITTVLGLRQLKTSFWDLTAASTVKRHLPELLPLMFPGGVPQPPAEQRVRHLALGRRPALATPFSPAYSGGGAWALTNGLRAKLDYHDGHWQGYRAHEPDVTIDLGKPTPVRSIATGFLQHVGAGIWLPTKVEYAVSDDGKTFRTVATVTHDVPEREPGPLKKELTATLRDVQARYVRMRAATIGHMPAWHHGRDHKAWMFLDEIVVR